MAKSARSSDRKRNNANLRAKVFGPAHDARTARLSAKLQELAAKPNPEQEKVMDVDEVDDAGQGEGGDLKQDADVDMTGVTVKRSFPKKSKSTHRIEKKNSRQKPKNKMIFPTSAAKRKRIAQSKRKAVS